MKTLLLPFIATSLMASIAFAQDFSGLKLLEMNATVKKSNGQKVEIVSSQALGWTAPNSDQKSFTINTNGAVTISNIESYKYIPSMQINFLDQQGGAVLVNLHHTTEFGISDIQAWCSPEARTTWNSIGTRITGKKTTTLNCRVESPRGQGIKASGMFRIAVREERAAAVSNGTEGSPQIQYQGGAR